MLKVRMEELPESVLVVMYLRKSQGGTVKDLPKWETLKANFPAVSADRVFKLIGGKVELNYDIGVFENACTLRVSRTLNLSGGQHVIPYIKGLSPNGKMEAQVSSGSNKLWHIFRVKALFTYLKQNYGDPEGYDSKSYKKSLKDRKGIIIFEVSGWEDASGHADLWSGEKALWQGYGGISSKIFFWEAQK